MIPFNPACAIDKLSSFEKELKSITENFSASQLNWKVDSKSWSCLEIIDHLNQTHVGYIASIDATVNQKQPNWLKKVPLYHRLFDAVLLWATKPRKAFNLKSPAVFKPTASNFNTSHLSSFYKTLKKFRDLIDWLDIEGLGNIKIESPINKSVIVSLGAAIELNANHNLRHLEQIKRVVAHPNFPKE